MTHPGWRMADGSMPLGDYDAVDPELAQFDYLPVPNVPEIGDYSVHSRMRLGLSMDVSWQNLPQDHPKSMVRFGATTRIRRGK